MSEENIEIGWSDFLGNSVHLDVEWKAFGEALAFARSLNLKSVKEWRSYHKENRPEGIPATPDKTYKDKGWTNWGDFLGTGNKSTYEWKSFEEAREFARSLNLKRGKEWNAYHKENKPEGIPSAPHKAYKDKGWKGMGDFLGTGNKSTYEWLPFEEARKLARGLKLRGAKEWSCYHKENKPEGVPANPHSVYKDKGWTNWGDFLGTGNTHKGDWKSFKEAREFARSLNLKNQEEWWLYHRENRPEGIPQSPNVPYKDKGWKGYGDFLGTGNTHKGDWLPLEEARAFARSLNLKSVKGWWSYHKDNKPERVPYKPNEVYKDKGWKGYKDFLGN